MTWDDTSDDPVDFDEAVEQFRKLTPIGDDDYEALTARAKRKAFKVAGIAQLDLVQDTFDAIADALENGTDLDEFKDAVGDALESAWHGGVENPGWRLETIFRTNVQRAYGEGRYRQATDPDTLQDRPYWQFDAVLDDATTDVCEDCQGTVLPADDPWWGDHLPPLHFNCRSTFITLTEEQARAAGGIDEKGPDADAHDGFGEPPLDDTEPDQEQADYEPDLSDYDPGLAAEFLRQQEDAPPAPEPKAAKEGVHYSSVSRKGLTKAEQLRSDEAMSALADYDLLGELEATPLKEIRLRHKITDGNFGAGVDLAGVEGYYAPSDGAIELRLNDYGFKGETFRPGKTWRVADGAGSWDEAVKLNMLHETAHHLHFSGGDEVDKVIRRAWNSSGKNPISRYGAERNHYEYWAETFSAHRVHPDLLQEHDPVGHQMVKDVLQLRKKL